MKRILLKACALTVLGCSVACAPADDHDIVIRGGTIVDGTGAPAYTGDDIVEGARLTEAGDRASPG